MKRANIIKMFLFFILFFPLASTPSHAWKLPIEVATSTDDGDKVYNRIVIGIESGATDGFDNLWDTQALLSHPDPDKPVILRAYLNIKKNDGWDTLRLWKDIRGAAASGNSTWNLTVESVPSGKSVVISWDLPLVALKPGEKLELKDNGKSGINGEPMLTDVSHTTSYTYVSDSEEPRGLSLVLKKENTDRHGSGSGFGCGTIKSGSGGPADGGSAAIGIIMLFVPMVFLRFIRYFYRVDTDKVSI